MASRLTALFVVPAYTGAILAFILTPKFEYPFRNIKELVEDRSYQLGYIEENTGFKRHSEATNDLYIKIACEELSVPIQEPTWEKSIIYAFKRLCEDHHFTFMHYEFYHSLIDTFKKYGYCSVKKIPESIYPSWAAMQLRYESPYLQIFNRILKTLKSSGVFTRIQNYALEYKNGSALIKWDTNENTNNPVDISKLKSIFIMVAFLYTFSVITLVAELIINKIKKRM